MQRRHFLIGTGAVVGAAAVGGVVSFATMGSQADYADRARALRRPLDPEGGIAEAVRYAALAANGHNTQPWRFSATAGGLAIAPDPSRRTPVVDPDDHHLFVSLGGAAENAVLALRAIGRGGAAIVDAGGTEVAVEPGAGDQQALLGAIPLRQSTRADYDGRPVAPDLLARLEAAAAEPGVRMVLVTDAPRRARIRDLVVAGNDAQMADPAFMAELKRWIRFNPRAAMASGDGLFSGCTGNPSIPGWVGRALFGLLLDPGAESHRYAGHAESSAGFAVFFADRADPAHWVRVGRASQRFALAATALGLRHAYLNQPVEVAELRADLAALAGETLRPDLVMRFGHGPSLPYSLRRPAAETFIA